jgi:hypothetical protein
MHVTTICLDTGDQIIKMGSEERRGAEEAEARIKVRVRT